MHGRTGKTFYTASYDGGGAEGYVDYPSLDGEVGTVGKYPTVEQNAIGGQVRPGAGGSSKL